ncbi:hypothetical protein [Nesterenkonia muleiensis]|uniref:hypothetical protein n=1 Tax=Nesterenkonia muleiensis TaxID=2282648 RepID=UPI000E718D70|nr:hypothetical protein [Nesterenkonia muleiensis]
MNALYIRWQAAQPNRHGHKPGVFALVNGLAKSGRLSDQDWAWWRASNDWYNGAYTNPADVDPDVFNSTVHPGAAAYFKLSAAHLLERVPGYLNLLDKHGVAHECLRTSAPGRIVYEDQVQIVAVREKP